MSRVIEKLYKAACNRSWSFYQHVNHRVTVPVGPHSIAIPVRCGVGLRMLDWRPSELAIAMRACGAAGRTGCFVDVGANLGQSLLDLLIAEVDATYLGFEPDTEAAAYLNDLIRINHLANSHVLPIAVGAAEGSALLRTSTRAFAGATLDDDKTPAQMYSTEVRVVQSTGDTQLAHIPDDGFFLVKIDVEGHELAVLEGLSRTIARATPPIYVEVLGFDHFVDDSYNREYFGNLTVAEREQLVDARRRNGAAVEKLLLDANYRLRMQDANGALAPVEGIDLETPKPGLQGNRNVFAVPSSMPTVK